MVIFDSDFEFFSDDTDVVLIKLSPREIVELSWTEIEIEVDPSVVLGFR